MTEKSRVSDSNAGEVRGRVGVDEALVDGLGAEGVDPLGVLLEVVLEALAEVEASLVEAPADGRVLLLLRVVREDDVLHGLDQVVARHLELDVAGLALALAQLGHLPSPVPVLDRDLEIGVADEVADLQDRGGAA